jgi:hypothetical protein
MISPGPRGADDISGTKVCKEEFIMEDMEEFLISEMALPFERLRAEERLKERSDRLRIRDQWSCCSDRLKFMYRSAVLQDQIRDGLEEALVGGEEGALERHTTAARAAVTRLIEFRKQYSLAVKHGDSIVNKL